MRVALIGGTGLEALDGESVPLLDSAQTPYGRASGIPRRSEALSGAVFLNRHADDHSLLPHEINYRANLWLLNELGVDAVLAVFAVGGISRGLANGDFVLPVQIIDYTWGREHTFADATRALHADFTEPFDRDLCDTLVRAAVSADVDVSAEGVYGCTQGPRLETAAEIDRMERDGCTIVGMTGMPEAGLARELGLPYAGVCVVVNPAAGRAPGTIEVADMRVVVDEARPRLLRLVARFLELAEQRE